MNTLRNTANTIKDRIILFCQSQGITKAKFERNCGLSNGYINGIVDNIGTKKLESILMIYPNLNKVWLLTGEGDMLLSSPEIVEEAEEIYGEAESDVEDVTHSEMCRYALPFISNEVAQSRSANIKKLIETEDTRVERRTIRSLLGNEVSYMQKIITNAMEPLFQPGDVVFLRFLHSPREVLHGAIHLLDTKLYGTLVRQVTCIGSRYRLHSANMDYADVELDEEDIYSASLIVGSLRTSFNMPNHALNYAQMISTKDRQIDVLINELTQQNKRIEALVSKVIEYADSKK